MAITANEYCCARGCREKAVWRFEIQGPFNAYLTFCKRHGEIVEGSHRDEWLPVSAPPPSKGPACPTHKKTPLASRSEVCPGCARQYPYVVRFTRGKTIGFDKAGQPIYELPAP